MRSKNVVFNAITNIIGQLIILIMNFISRKLFLTILDANYLGVSGLFSNVITVLSLAELGIGSTITFSLYKPLKNEDNDTIRALMNLYKKIYRIIGISIFLIGIAITPVALYMTNLKKSIPHLALIYFMFVGNAAISYFYSYSRTLIAADQKEYRLALIDYLTKILLVLFQMFFLYMTGSFIVYLIIQILMTYLQNYFVYKKVYKLYPVMSMKGTVKLSVDEIQILKKNNLAMIIYKFAIVIVSGTDNLIISKLLGTIWVGFYSNYSMIILSIQTIISKVISATTASIGNVLVSSDIKQSYLIYETLQYICFIIYGTVSIFLIVLLNPFICLVYGDEYVLEFITVITLVINFYLLGMQGSSSNFRDAFGLFWEGKFRPLLQGILNLVISILLVLWMKNITAVFLGTIISRICTITWIDPYIVHKYGFKNIKKLKAYWGKFLKYIFYVSITCFVTYNIAYCFNENTILGFLYKVSICTVVPVGSFFILTFQTKEFKYLFDKLKKIFIKKGDTNEEVK